MADVTAISPLAPDHFPDLPLVEGVSFASVAAGVRYQGRRDVMLALCTPGTAIAGVFTRSATRAASVLDCQAKLGKDAAEGAAILVNAGNANAFTGRNGTDAVTAITSAVAKAAGVPQDRVFTSSTGVIGEPLPYERITGVLEDLVAAQDAGGIDMAAQAILTTDTFAKGSGRVVEIGGQKVHIAGIAKGSGMIAPDMATMLVYIFTDAQIAQPALQKMVGALADQTFNCITVDSDTSTSDMVLAAATGKSGIAVDDDAVFQEALFEVMMDLAHQVVRDGEGATKFVQIDVTGARTDKDAHTHAMAIANSPLVKTAIAGEDPNWGRVVMAIGKSGAEADRDLMSIRFGDSLVAEEGWVSPEYDEEKAAAHMKGQHISIAVDLGLGHGARRVWTCDLTHGYIAINADYRS